VNNITQAAIDAAAILVLQKLACQVKGLLLGDFNGPVVDHHQDIATVTLASPIGIYSLNPNINLSARSIFAKSSRINCQASFQSQMLYRQSGQH
jgi:hypothetical protein